MGTPRILGTAIIKFYDDQSIKIEMDAVDGIRMKAVDIVHHLLYKEFVRLRAVTRQANARQAAESISPPDQPPPQEAPPPPEVAAKSRTWTPKAKVEEAVNLKPDKPPPLKEINKVPLKDAAAGFTTLRGRGVPSEEEMRAAAYAKEPPKVVPMGPTAEPV